MEWNFNTTLVIVYLNSGKKPTVVIEFQYNSCYCLSGYVIRIENNVLDFNTTLVIVYRL